MSTTVAPVASAAPAAATPAAASTTPTTPAATQQPAAAAAPAKVETPAAQTPLSAEKLNILRARQQLEQDKAALAPAQKIVEAAKSKDAMRILQAAGMSAEDVAKFLVGGGAVTEQPKPTKVGELEAKLTEQQKVIEGLSKAETERQQQVRQAEEKAARDEAIAALAAAPDLVWVNALGQGDAVIAELQAAAKRGETPEFEAVAKQVEAKFAATMPAYLDKLVANPSVRTAIEAALAKAGKAAAPAAGTAPVKPEEKPAEQPAAPGGFVVKRRNTLSNDLSASGGGNGKPKTPDEIWAAQVAKFKATG